MRKVLFTLTTLLITFQTYSQNPVKPGAERLDQYLHLIKGKNIGLFANQTSMVGSVHLADTLSKLGVKIKVIFGPEHGFRGTASAGEKVGNYIDEETGIPVVSLYGSKRRPSAEDLKDVDIMLFDIQDVGVRFYTYISSMQEYMESAFENNKPLIILDRPNPNGFYVDGPVLQDGFQSFIGMQHIPIVYGLTIGEYAHMLVGEKWLNEKANAAYSLKLRNRKKSQTDFQLLVIENENYDHNTKYVLPVKPSPNLPNIQSIYLYPSTCLFEGTTLSEGRGTEKPFQVFGAPSLPDNLYSFTPVPRPGATSSKHYHQLCYGWDVSGTIDDVLQKTDKKIQLQWVINAYKLFPEKDSFFIVPKSGNMDQSFFSKLAGNGDLWKQIRDGKSEEEIRDSWEPQLTKYKQIRKKYLLYKDFE